MSLFSVERMITVDSIYCLAPQIAGNATTTFFGASTWPTANKAIFVGFEVWETATFDRIITVNGGTVSGNLDVGIYDKTGALLASDGGTAQAGTNRPQIIKLASLELVAGFYYFALVFDNAAATLFRYFVPLGVIGSQNSVFTQSSAYPLPATVTFAAPSQTVPWIGLMKEDA